VSFEPSPGEEPSRTT